MDLQVQKEPINPKNDKNWPVRKYPSIRSASILVVKEDCGRKNIEILAPKKVERVTFKKSGFMYIYRYPFTLIMGQEINPISLEFCHNY